MTSVPDRPDDLHKLLSGLADGTLDTADEQRLAELLRTDPAARASYYDHVMLEALLRREGRRTAAQEQSRPTGPVGQEAELAVPLRLSAGSSSRFTTARHRPWLLLLAASVLLCLILSVGEATGVTRFVPTIIRIVTGEGSLVIEVDDPAVSVKLDGEDVTITGAGVHELRLRPGPHKLVATKDGQPLREEAVTIERGGRRVLMVSREPPAAAGPSELRSNRLAGVDEVVQQAGPRASPRSPGRPRVLMVIAPRDFYYPEYGTVRNVLEMQGVQCVVVSTTLAECWPNDLSPQISAQPNVLLRDARAADYSAVYFCGGPGIETYAAGGEHAGEAARLIHEALAAGRTVAAMGMAAVVLAEAGALAGKQATCNPYGSPPGLYIRRLKAAGATWHDEAVVEDGLLITGRQPADIPPFTRTLLLRLEIEPLPRPPPVPPPSDC